MERAANLEEHKNYYKNLEETYIQAARQSGLRFWILDLTKRAIYSYGNALKSSQEQDLEVLENVPESLIECGTVHPDDIQGCRQMYERIYAGEKMVKSIGRWKQSPFNGWKWCEVCYTTVFDETGKPIKAVGSLVDVTEKIKLRTRYEEAIARRELYNEDVIASFRMNLTQNICGDGQGKDPLMTAYRQYDTVDAFFEADYMRCADLGAMKEYQRNFNRESLIKSYMKGDITPTFEQTYYYTEEKIIWVMTKAVLMQNPETLDVEACIYVIDIDKQKASQALVDAVVGMDYDYLALLDAATDNYTLFAQTDHCTPLPPFYASSYKEEVEKYAREYVIEEDVEQNIKQMSSNYIIEQLRTQKVFTCYARVRGSNGDIRRKKLQFSYLDKVRKLIMITRTDITEQYKEEQRKSNVLKDALIAAQQANSAKTDFLSRMSHEIRTPMNAIIGMSALAAQFIKDPEQLAECISKIGISARFLLSLINDILDMTRIESGKVLIKYEKIPFEEFLHGINSISFTQAQQKGVEYDSLITSFTEEYYIGDAMKLQQILINIISNAIKFTPQGGKVQLLVHQEKIAKNEAVMKFTINDTGIGIKEAFLPHLFQPFEQEDTTVSSAYCGTGLGLAICKNLVDLMGGTINVNSIEGVGSEFVVELRLGISEESQKAARIQSDLRFEKLSALIVDDDIIICQHTRQILSDMGLSAEWVDSGRKAVELVYDKWMKHVNYDVILVDWKMPDMDGIETTKKIRAIVGPDVTIIIMTAYDWISIEMEAKTAGVNMLLSKPLFKASLSSAFEKIYFQKECKVKQEQRQMYDFTGKRVLLVEDHMLNVEVARKLLSIKGFEVEVAENGLRAIENFVQKGEGYYHIILMDIRMPVMDGLTAAKSIRQVRKKDAKSIPIIAMTANAFEEDIAKTKEAGMNAHLAKPIEPELLYHTLQSFLEGEHLD